MSDSSKPRPRRMLVGVDFSDFSIEALRRAFEVAAMTGAIEIHALFVDVPVNDVVNPFAGPRPPTIELDTRRLTDLVGAELRRYAEHHGVFDVRHVSAHVEVGGAAHEIVRMAKSLHAELIVVGTHGRSGIGRALLGSVAEQVVRKAPCDVLVARERAA